MIRKLINLLLAVTVAFIIHTVVVPKEKKQIIHIEKRDVGREAAPHVVPWISDGKARRSATGFYLQYYDKTYILTNKHVCDANKLYKRGKYIQFKDYVGTVIAIDDRHDLCLVTSNRIKGLQLATRQSRPFDKIILVGYPLGMGKVIREGRIVEKQTILAPWLGPLGKKSPTYLISTITYPGNSGSPVLNEEGDVTGVLFAGPKYRHTESYIVPLYHIKIFLNEVIYGIKRR